MKTAGIITYHNGSNYGAALQAYALQKAMCSLGYNAFILDYENHFITKGLRKIRFEASLLGLYSSLYDIIHYKTNNRKIKRFREFFINYYNLTASFTFESSILFEQKFDIGLSGSDQIWNPLLNNGLDEIYFLRFGRFENKISYASSFGAYKLNDAIINEKLKLYLQDYKKISTREKGEELSKVLGRIVYDVCDPTLLLNKKDWINDLNLSANQGGYLLVYALADFGNVIAVSRKIAKNRNLRIKYIGRPLGFYPGIDFILDAGPKEFVDMFLNADYIVTNSFHGTAFSVNFEKQFVNVMHPKSPERAATFLKSIGLSSRIIIDSNSDLPDDINDIMYNSAMEKLNVLRQHSYNYLDV